MPNSNVKQMQRLEGLAAIEGLFKTNNGREKIVTDGKTAATVATELSTWAALENADEVGAKYFGGICYRVLQLEPKDQEILVTAVAAAMDVPAPDYTGAVSGRIQWAHVIYGKFPELCRVKAGQKDTRAGKRVSHALRVYKEAHGLVVQKKKAKVAKIPTRTLHSAFEWLSGHLKQTTLRTQLYEVFEHAGLGSELEKWTGLSTEKAAA